jgi:hypothetical protein
METQQNKGGGRPWTEEDYNAAKDRLMSQARELRELGQRTGKTSYIREADRLEYQVKRSNSCRRNSWLDSLGLGKSTKVYHRRGASFARGANYKGYRVWEDENGWHTSLDPGSWFDSQRDAKNLIDSWEKDRKNPRKCATCGGTKRVQCEACRRTGYVSRACIHCGGDGGQTCPDCKTRKNILPLSSLASGAGSAGGILGPSEKWLKKHGVMRGNSMQNPSYYSITAGTRHDTVRAARAAEVRALRKEGGGVGGIEKGTKHGGRVDYRTVIVESDQIRYQNPTAFCEAGQHYVEPGKTVNSRGWCNLCLKDVQHGRAPGTTARERGLKNPRNPEAESADGFEAFHGFRPTEQITVEKDVHYHSELWAVGELIKLIVVSPDGIEVDITGFKGAMLSANEANTQLYIEGGDQTVNLSDFGLGEPYHDKEDLGEVKKLFYFTNKTHLGDQGGEAVYHHKLGEEGTKRNYEFGKLEGRKVPRPRLAYDVVNQALEFIGGEYVIEPEGIRN